MGALLRGNHLLSGPQCSSRSLPRATGQRVSAPEGAAAASRSHSAFARLAATHPSRFVSWPAPTPVGRLTMLPMDVAAPGPEPHVLAACALGKARGHSLAPQV